MPPPSPTEREDQWLEDHLYDEFLRRLEPMPESERALLTAKTKEAEARRRALIEKILRDESRILTRERHAHLISSVVSRVVGLGPLQPLVDNPEIEEIIVNGKDAVFIAQEGRIRRTDPPVRFRDNQHILDVIDRIVGPLGRRVDASSPIVDARLEDGSRVNVIIPPLSVGGPAVTIRRFPREPFNLDRLLKENSLDKPMQQFLKAAVLARLNVLISGGTGSGKTSTLNALAQMIPPDERLITIEDIAELQIQHPNLVSLEARPPNIEGKGEVTIRTLVANALRMRPDRIIVGEVRRGEAFDMLQAMSTGHEGSLTTIHANSAEDALHRLEAMILMAGLRMEVPVIRDHISRAIEIIVHQERLMDGRRKILAISEVVRSKENSSAYAIRRIFEFKIQQESEEGVRGVFAATGYHPTCADKIRRKVKEFSDKIFQPPSQG